MLSATDSFVRSFVVHCEQGELGLPKERAGWLAGRRVGANLFSPARRKQNEVGGLAPSLARCGWPASRLAGERGSLFPQSCICRIQNHRTGASASLLVCQRIGRSVYDTRTLRIFAAGVLACPARGGERQSVVLSDVLRKFCHQSGRLQARTAFHVRVIATTDE